MSNIQSLPSMALEPSGGHRRVNRNHQYNSSAGSMMCEFTSELCYSSDGFTVLLPSSPGFSSTDQIVFLPPFPACNFSHL